MSSSKSSNGTPVYVRATEPIIDEGEVFALAGDVGEVLDVGDLDDGGRWVMVHFPNAPEPTMCFLGADVEPMLAVVPPAPEEPSQAPTPSPRPTAPSRPRRAGTRRAVAAAAAVLVGVMWCAAEDHPEELAAAEVQAPGGLASEPILVDVDNGVNGSALSGQRIPAPEDAPSDWRREPCPRDPRVRAIDGLCFVVLAGPPPCGVGYEHRGACVLPIAKGKPFPSSIRR